MHRKRAELKAHYDLAKAKTHAKAKAAEAEAHRRVEEARLDAEEQLIALSERGSSVASSRRQGSVSSLGRSGGPTASFKSNRGALSSVVRRYEPRVSVQAAWLGFRPNEVQPSLPMEDDVHKMINLKRFGHFGLILICLQMLYGVAVTSHLRFIARI